MRPALPLVFAAAFTLFAAVSASAALLQDTFDGSGALDPSKWSVTVSGAPVSVARAGDVAAFNLSSSCVLNDYGKAMSIDSWNPASGALTWSIDFAKTLSTNDHPLLEPFRYESPAGSLAVLTIYGDTVTGTAPVIYVYGPGGGLAWSAALYDSGSNLFYPATSNTYWQHLTVQLDATSVTATLLGTTNGTTQTTYTGTLNYSQYFGAGDRTGAFGMLVSAAVQGGLAQDGAFDNVLLTPEPATLALLGGGMLISLALRRRRRA